MASRAFGFFIGVGIGMSLLAAAATAYLMLSTKDFEPLGDIEDIDVEEQGGKEVIVITQSGRVTRYASLADMPPPVRAKVQEAMDALKGVSVAMDGVLKSADRMNARLDVLLQARKGPEKKVFN